MRMIFEGQNHLETVKKSLPYSCGQEYRQRLKVLESQWRSLMATVLQLNGQRMSFSDELCNKVEFGFKEIVNLHKEVMDNM